ncbi:uncharacterized protein LOC143012339 [Genypterus blacodes]|uniref:uncharacterized protein LOC143012339 n=1 Tax=Genypterus blacodes TaxID=154954 RepID=UPI003F768785
MEPRFVEAELTFRDGKTEKISVKIKNNENNLTSVMEGIHKLSEKVSNLLSELVEREKVSGANTQGVEEDDSDEDEDEEEDDEEEEEQLKCDLHPPAKRSKT